MIDLESPWNSIGETEPYFAMLAHERFLRRNINDDTIAEFWKSGDISIFEVRQILMDHFGTGFYPKSAVDFGCGVGRQTRAIAKLAGWVYGIDNSSPMLEEARRNDAPANIQFQSDLPKGPVEWIHSAITFQHILPELGYISFQSLLDLAAPGCLLSAHFTLFKDGKGLANNFPQNPEFAAWDGNDITQMIFEEAQSGHIGMYDYDLNKLVAILIRSGFGNYFMRHSDHGGCHGVEIFSKRSE